MIKRKALDLITQHLKKYPAVAIIGARQTGKTTIAKKLSPNYYDLEDDRDQLRLDMDWEKLMSENNLIVLDEAQSYPEIFPRLRHEIDKNRQQMGRFLILGSVAPSLMKEVSQSLTGRMALVKLSPLLLPEVGKNKQNELWLKGGYPEGGILNNDNYPNWQKNYLELIAQKDLPLWGLPAKPQVTQRLFKMISALHGQCSNTSQLGKSLDLTHPTINTYLDYLEGAFLIRKLPPFFSNLKKRLVKTPKIYWRDSGLLHSMLNTPDFQSLQTKPWVGASWEGFVIEQILSFLEQSTHSFDAYFFRTHDGYEIDLLLEYKGLLWAIEIKTTSRVNSQDVSKFQKATQLIKPDKHIIISQTNTKMQNDNLLICNLSDFLKELA